MDVVPNVRQPPDEPAVGPIDQTFETKFRRPVHRYEAANGLYLQ